LVISNNIIIIIYIYRLFVTAIAKVAEMKVIVLFCAIMLVSLIQFLCIFNDFK
jgi:hypothetical protein